MFQRLLFEDLKAHLHRKEFSIITGARQTGKTTLLKQLEKYCTQENQPTLFLNLENKTILDVLNDHPFNLLGFLTSSEKRIIVFIDEIQYLNDPSNFLKLIFDEHSDRIKLVVTGSSAFYLDEKFRDSLAGRKRLFKLLTCTFWEFLGLKEQIQLQDELERIIKLPSAKSTLIDYLRIQWEEYMTYGGYPAVIMEPDKKEKINLLKEIRDSFIKRDILEAGLTNENALYQLFRILAGQTGSLMNVNELASTLKIKNETAAKYLYVLQKCFHISLTRPFHRNIRKELVKMPKVFLLDTGLRNCLLNNFQSINERTDKGELWENMIFRWLADKYGEDEIKFWRTSSGNEVDFVLPEIDSPLAIEVKFDKKQVKPNKYKIFENAYPELPVSFMWFSPFNENFFKRNMV
jgi:predicted AAA+ superfamily ATPase